MRVAAWREWWTAPEPAAVAGVVVAGRLTFELGTVWGGREASWRWVEPRRGL